MKKLRSVMLILMATVLMVTMIFVGCAEPEPAEPVAPAEPAAPTEPAAPAEPAAPEPIILKYATAYMEGIAHSAAQAPYLDMIEEKTNGRVQFETYWAGTLIGEREAYDQIAAGVCDLGHIELAWLQYGNEITTALGSMFIRSPDRVTSLKIFDELCEKFPEITAEASKVKLLGNVVVFPMDLMVGLAEPVYTLADLEGMQIITSPQYEPFLRHFGASLSPLPSMEMYTGLQKGLCDADLMPLDMLSSLGLADVVTSATKFNLSATPQFAVAMNWDTWNSLPADIQKVFDDNRDYVGYVSSIETWDEMMEESLRLADELGIEIIDLSPEEQEEVFKVFDGIAEGKAAELDDMGKPGTEIWEEIQRLLEKYKS